MKAPRRRARADSIAAQTSVASKAGSNLTPPSHIPLADGDEPFWRNVVAEFARADWSEHQLELAAFLARTMADFERESGLLRSEGAIVKTDKGTPVANPRKTIAQMHASTILSLRRSLSLHARAQGGEARDVGERREANKAVDKAAKEAGGLINRPGGAR